MLAQWTKFVAWVTDEEKGASMVEYALLVVLIAIIAIVAITLAGRNVSEAFSNIASGDGLGKPEVLAAGIYQALTTTAAGLAVAIPALVAYYALRGQVERFGARTESIYRELDLAVRRVGA